MKGKRLLFDAYAVLVYLKKQKGGDIVTALLMQSEQEGNPLLMSIINWGEVLYMIEREEGVPRVKEVEALLEALNIQIVAVTAEIIRQAARYKARGRISYADAIAAGTAKTHGAALVTGDQEFKALEKEIKIIWI